MQTKWINKNGNASLVLFFNGWGMDENILSDISHENFDVLMVYDYSDLLCELPETNNYQHITLVAWSMGVWAAEIVLSQTSIKPNKCIAFNGTPTPMHEQTGINPQIFMGTIANWSDAARQKFYARIAGDRKTYMQFAHLFSTKAVEAQKSELQAIAMACNNITEFLVQWNCAIIGLQDAIFLPQNQRNFWHGKTTVIEREMAHVPFLGIVNWGMLIKTEC